MNVSDLTPDALARLEAKLMADLDVVRKVRALLEEHQIPSGMAAVPSGAGATPSVVATDAAAPAAVPVPSVPVPLVPAKSYEEIFTESLKAMPPEGFNLGALKNLLWKAGLHPDDSRVKQDMNRLIRQGKVVVVKSAIGRIGSTYRYAVPVEESSASVVPKVAEAQVDAETDKPSAANSEAGTQNGRRSVAPDGATVDSNQQDAEKPVA